MTPTLNSHSAPYSGSEPERATCSRRGHVGKNERDISSLDTSTGKCKPSFSDCAIPSKSHFIMSTIPRVAWYFVWIMRRDIPAFLFASYIFALHIIWKFLLARHVGTRTRRYTWPLLESFYFGDTCAERYLSSHPPQRFVAVAACLWYHEE